MAGTKFFVKGDYNYARATVDQVLENNGFKLDYTDPYNLQAERGSKGKTLILGAFAGKKGQHMKLSANYAVDANGTQVVTFFQSNTGMAGGVIGYQRIAGIFSELVHEIYNAFSTQGTLLGSENFK